MITEKQCVLSSIRVVLALVLLLCSSAARPIHASTEDDCIEAQEHLKAAKEVAAEAAEEYSVCVTDHDTSDDCAAQKAELDIAHDEVEAATDAARMDCT
jgi:hypothetical protein